MQEGLTERGPWGKIGQWWMAIGGALERRNFPVSCKRVAFSRIGGSGKAAQIPEEGNGSWERESGMGWGRPRKQGQCWERTWSKSWHQNVRKNSAYKESSQEKSHVQEQSLMAGSSHQAGQGKMAQHRFWARRGFYRRGRLRKLVHAWESLVQVGLS
jgi:hypothetical protein